MQTHAEITGQADQQSDRHGRHGSLPFSKVGHRARFSSASGRPVLRLVDFQRAAAEVRAIQRLHGARCFITRHFDESEPPWLTGGPVHHDGNRLDGAVSRKRGTHGFFGRRKRQIANIEFGHVWYSRVGKERMVGNACASRTFPRWRHLVHEIAPNMAGTKSRQRDNYETRSSYTRYPQAVRLSTQSAKDCKRLSEGCAAPNRSNICVDATLYERYRTEAPRCYAQPISMGLEHL